MWICGYANAYGGTLYIGKEDNTGNVIGVSDARKLMKQLPDKITSALGIIADVNLLFEEELQYLEQWYYARRTGIGREPFRETLIYSV